MVNISLAAIRDINGVKRHLDLFHDPIRYIGCQHTRS